MSPRLALRPSHEPEAPITLPEEGRLTIGSSPDRSDYVLTSQGVADIHCIITGKKEGGWTVQDMGSEFGTLLDGQRIDVAQLHAGQSLHVASISFEVIDLLASKEEATPEAPPAPEPVALTEEPAEASTGNAGATTEQSFIDIPGYSIQQTLGRGGMGAVFLARQDRLHRDVALKILSPRLAADTDFVRKFHREAQAAAAFNHPNVVTVYDVGEAGGTHYLAMEYMNGESLEELLVREGRLPWKQVAQMLLGAARGLVYAESRGIVHRDIKPSNLMLNSDGQVKLADLGLAQRDDEDSSDGRIFGTPHFMPPEQIKGETVDRRSDIYALGATGYRLLSGYTPFEGVSSREILRAVLTEQFDPLRTHVTGVPHEFTRLIERMISRSPDSRPQSAESVVSNLEGVLAGRTSPSAPVVTAAPARSNKGGMIAACALGAAVLGWVVWKNSASGPSPVPEPEITQAPAHDPGTSDVQQEPVYDPSIQDAEDDDVAQKLFESKAENELLRLRSAESSLSLPDMQSALFALAQKYNGTTAASMARKDAEGITDIMVMQRDAEAAHVSRREAVLLVLRDAANLDVETPRPGDALRNMASVPNQELLADDDIFQGQRESLRSAVCARALEQARAQLDEAKSRLADPDPTPVRDSLQDLVIRLQLPELPPNDRPAGFEDLRRLSAEARDLLRNLSTHRKEVTVERVRNDSEAIAAACHAPDGLELNLSLLRSSQSAETLESLAAALNTEEARASIASLAGDLRAAGAALSALISEFDSWRRKTIADPRPRRGNTEATAVGPEGIEVLGAGGSELIEWRHFADQPDALHQLFNRRLNANRAWTKEEMEGIAVLLRHAAVLNTVRKTRACFTEGTSLKKSEIQKILEAYEPAAEWSERTPQAVLLGREIDAAKSLTRALELAAKEQWSAATSTLVHTQRSYGETLLLLMLSDGSGASTSPTAQDQAAPPALDPEGPAVPSPPDPGGE